MKLPKCPHCEKLMIGIVGDSYAIGDRDHEHVAVYLCPESMTRKDPDWVEVLEV